MRFSMRPERVYDGYEQIRGEELARRGIRLLLCDLDYTLAPKSQREPDETVRQWIDSMRRAGVEVMILSNNRSPARVGRFCRDLGITYEGPKAVRQGLPQSHGAGGRDAGGDRHAGR